MESAISSSHISQPAKNLIREEIKYNLKLSCLRYNKIDNYIATGDEKGRISFFDSRDSKPFKLFLGNKQNGIKY